jgi:hypothetical protein
MARSMARAGALSGPSVTSWLRGFSSLGMATPYRGLSAGTGVAVLAGCLVLAGCSIKAKSTVSPASVQRQIASQLAGTYHVALPPVHCPASIPAQVGTRFKCTVEVDRQVLGVNGKVTGTHGQVVVRPASAVVNVAAAEVGIARHLTRTFGQPVSVGCQAPALLVAAPGHSFSCTAHVGAIARQVVVSVSNLNGALAYRVLPYHPSG